MSQPIELTNELVVNALQSKRLKDKYNALAIASAAANNHSVMIGIEQSDMREGDKFATQAVLGLAYHLCQKMADPSQGKNLWKQLNKCLGKTTGYQVMEELNAGRPLATNLGAEEEEEKEEDGKSKAQG